MPTFTPKQIFRKLRSVLGFPENRFRKFSYSQTGEDLIVDFIFQNRGIALPSYIDIGAYQPEFLSNTNLFYKKGCRGINIEPNPDNIGLFYKKRPHDTNLNFGIGIKEEELAYFNMNISTMNTFDAKGAEELVQKHGFSIVSKTAIPVKPLRYVIETYNSGVFPDFLSLDVEGLDLDILQSIDYAHNYPKVICVETIEYTNDGTGGKNTVLIEFLKSNGYYVYADTYINTIFVHSEFWFNKN